MPKGSEPAFPRLTKRELFAAMAMQGILRRGDQALTGYYEGVSKHAVRHADALLAALGDDE